MSLHILPVNSRNNQKFSTTLVIDGVTKSFRIELRYNYIAKYWTIKISDPSQKKIMIDSLPLVSGASPAKNIFHQFKYKEIGSLYLVNISGIKQDSPDNTNLGKDFQLWWDDTDG